MRNIFTEPEIFLTKKVLTMSETAKALNIPNLGRNKLYNLLRANGIIDDSNSAHQKYVELGYFTNMRTDKSFPNYVVHVTPDGFGYIQSLVQ